MRKPLVLQFLCSLSFLAVLLTILTCTALAQDIIGSSASVLTWKQDINVSDECSGCSYRTGENLAEATITYSSIKTDSFGQLCASAVLDGQVYAQPLVVKGVKWQGLSVKTVVYVVTQNDTIYAFDGGTPTSKTCHLLGSLNFFTTTAMMGQYKTDCTKVGGSNCNAIKPYIGILGTPVISVDTVNNKGTIYLVTESQSGTQQTGFTFYHYLHALDIATLTELAASPVRISDSTGASAFSKIHIQRPGLLYGTVNGQGYVYVAFSMMDGNRNPYPNGAIFSFNASTLVQSGYFATSAGTFSHDGGGIWQDGAGLAYAWDNNHTTRYIYFNTGNGVYNADNSGTDYGDTFLKMYQVSSSAIGFPTGSLANYSFTPADTYYRDNSCNILLSNDGDWDLDSGGVMLIPEHELYDPSLAVSADKEGGIYFVDRTTPGGHHTNTACETTCSCSYDDNNVITQNFWIGAAHTGPVVHSTPAFWESSTPTAYLYISTMTDGTNSGELMQYTLCPSAGQKPISSTSPCTSTTVAATDSSNHPVIFGNGVTPVISAASTAEASAIVWAIWNDGLSYGSTNPGILYAFDAVNMTYLYASSACPGRDAIAPATKFSVASVANGLVYVGAQGPSGNTGAGMFYIFGPSATGAC